MTAPKPTMTPKRAMPGKLIDCVPSGFWMVPSVIIQPTVALARRRTKRTAVAVIEPRTVIIPDRHGLTGPSLTPPAGPVGRRPDVAAATGRLRRGPAGAGLLQLLLVEDGVWHCWKLLLGGGACPCTTQGANGTAARRGRIDRRTDASPPTMSSAGRSLALDGPPRGRRSRLAPLTSSVSWAHSPPQVGGARPTTPLPRGSVQKEPMWPKIASTAMTKISFACT